GSDVRLSVVHVGPHSELNVFEIAGNEEADRQTPMFGRGRIDHLALQADSLDAFENIRDRLVARGASDGFVTDFGPILSVFFRDPDGLECEVCVENPDAQPGVSHPPGTPAARYHGSSYLSGSAVEEPRRFEPHPEVRVLGTGGDGRATRSDAERRHAGQRLPPDPRVGVVERALEERTQL